MIEKLRMRTKRKAYHMWYICILLIVLFIHDMEMEKNNRFIKEILYSTMFSSAPPIGILELIPHQSQRVSAFFQIKKEFAFYK